MFKQTTPPHPPTKTFLDTSRGQIELGKKSKKKTMIANIVCFLVDFIRPTGPMVNVVTRYTGGLSQLLLVKMSWGKISMEKHIIVKLNTSPPFLPPPGRQG